MNLSDISTIETLLKTNGFSFKKSLGQNFLINSSVCPAMADACCSDNSGVLEIGPGIGVLTKELSKKAKKVVAIELDERLKKILPVTLSECNNVEVIYQDVMKTDLLSLFKEKFSDCDNICVCANLPYYITSPIVMMLLERRLPVKYITVMVQKEAAERLCATVGTRAAGAVTVAVDYYSNAEILFSVDRKSFLPAPNVDSAIIRLCVRKNPEVKVKNEKEFFKFVKCCFAQRRKTLINTVYNTSGFSKELIKRALNSMNISETIRSEQLSIEQLAELSDLLIDNNE